MASFNDHVDVGESAQGSTALAFLTEIKSVALLIASSTLARIFA
jgi:hypothetical protein